MSEVFTCELNPIPADSKELCLLQALKERKHFMGLLIHLKKLFPAVLVQVTHPYCHCLVGDLQLLHKMHPLGNICHPRRCQYLSCWRSLDSDGGER